MPCRRPGVNPISSQLNGVNAEKILENVAISAALHRRQPGEFEFLRSNPADRAEFGVWSRHVHGAFRSAQTKKKIMMGLSAESLFHQTGRKAIAVRPAAADDAVGISWQGNLFEHLADQSRSRGFAEFDPALRKLPGAGSIRALANENAPCSILQDGGDGRTIKHPAIYHNWWLGAVA